MVFELDHLDILTKELSLMTRTFKVKRSNLSHIFSEINSHYTMIDHEENFVKSTLVNSFLAHNVEK